MKSICIYVLHWDKLTDRMKNIQRLRDLVDKQTSCVVEIILVEDHNPGTFNTESIKNLIKLDLSADDPLYNFRTQLSQRTLSNTLKHFTALQQIATRNADEQYNLILEDDFEINDTFIVQLDELLNHIENSNDKTFDMMFLGYPPDQNTDKTQISFSEININSVPLITCESYVVSLNAAKQLMINYFPISFDTTVHLTQLLRNHNLKPLKTFPNLAGDGSKIGTYPSSIKDNNILLFNMDYKTLYRNLESKSDFLEMNTSIYENTVYKDHPDILHMMALTYLKNKLFSESITYFKKAYEEYDNHNCSMGKNSVFMKNYITAHKFLQ